MEPSQKSIQDIIAILETPFSSTKNTKIKRKSEVHKLPSNPNIMFRIDDYSVFDDDKFYSNISNPANLYLRRGTAVIYALASPGDTSPKPIFMLAGSPKFGYFDDVLTEQLNEPEFNKTKLVYTEKENGEAGHLAFFKYNDEWYAIIGSKNVHIVISVRDEKAAWADFEYYKNIKETRYGTAVANASLFISGSGVLLLSSNAPEHEKMRTYLFENNYTIVFEAIFNNHLVSYSGPNRHIAFAITGPQFNTVKEQGLVMSPEESLKLLANWGFNVAKKHVISNIKEQALKKKSLDTLYETKDNSEGAVVYEIYTNKAGKEIVGKIYKHKNFIYIIKRAARELIAGRKNYAAWERRFSDFHIDIKNNVENKNAVENLLAFYVHAIKTKPPLEIADIGQTIQKDFTAFMESTTPKVREDLRNIAKEVIDSNSLSQQSRKGTSAGPQNKNWAIMLVGLQGSGKTTMRNMLMLALGPGAIYANQDEVGGNRKAFINALSTVPKANQVIIIDKCNHLTRLRNDVYERYEKVIIVEFKHRNGHAPTVECLLRIKKRGLCHPTLVPGAATAGILKQCSDDYEAITETEKTSPNHLYIELPIKNSPFENLTILINKLKDSNVISPSIPIPTPEAIANSNAKYETDAKEALKKTIIYWKAQVKPEDEHLIDEIYKRVGEKSGIIKQAEYHLTLAPPGANIDHDKYMNYITKTSTELEITVEAVVWDNKCLALRVERSDILKQLCVNAIPHITIGCISGTKPVHSNTMLQAVNETRTAPLTLTLSLAIMPVMRTVAWKPAPSPGKAQPSSSRAAEGRQQQSPSPHQE